MTYLCTHTYLSIHILEHIKQREEEAEGVTGSMMWTRTKGKVNVQMERNREVCREYDSGICRQREGEREFC